MSCIVGVVCMADLQTRSVSTMQPALLNQPTQTDWSYLF